MRTASLCVVTLRVVSIPCQHFGTSYRSHVPMFKGQESKKSFWPLKKDSWMLKMWPIGCPETSVTMTTTHCLTTQKNTVLTNTFCFYKTLCRFCDNVEKYCRVWQATDDSTTHASYMMDTRGCKHTLRIYNTYCFSTATTCLFLYISFLVDKWGKNANVSEKLFTIWPTIAQLYPTQ